MVEQWEKIGFIALTALLLAVSWFYLYPVSITYDPAMHAEIVQLIRFQGYLQTWQPYADNSFTYQPLFHYLAVLFTALLPAIEAVRILGILIYITTPLAMYFLVSTFRKDIAFMAAVILVLLPGFVDIFALGEFPQLLSMELLLILLYFLRKQQFLHAAVITGLVILSHPFMALIAVLIHLFYLTTMRSCSLKTRVLYLIIPLLIASVWIPQYLTIATNALTGTWQNAVFSLPPYNQPFFWFWPAETIGEFLLGLHKITPLIFLLSLYGFFRTRDTFLRAFFLLTLIFTVFHLPYTQLKVLDLFAIPAAILAAVALSSFSTRMKRFSLLPVILVIGLLFALQVNHLFYLRSVANPDISPSPELIEISSWLEQYDPVFVRIYTEQSSAWIGILAHKRPMNPEVTFLEAFSPSYLEQLADRGTITHLLMQQNPEGLMDVVNKWEIQYVITRHNQTVPFLHEVHAQGDWIVYQVRF